MIIFFIYKIKFSERARQAFINEVNAKKIELNMSKFEMLQIMGEPDEILSHPVKDNITVYYYEPTFGTSDGIYFHVNSSMKIVYIKQAE